MKIGQPGSDGNLTCGDLYLDLGVARAARIVAGAGVGHLIQSGSKSGEGGGGEGRRSIADREEEEV